MNKNSVPTFDELMNPTIRALRVLGGSGTIEEIYAKVAELEKLTEAQLSVPHVDTRRNNGYISEVEYRLAWTRTYLKGYGILENSSRGVWSLTEAGREIEQVDPQKVKRFVRSRTDQIAEPTESNTEILQSVSVPLEWRDLLLNTLLEMQPDAFERLTQRMLRESGFVQVEVTGRSGDGGIDGKGILRVGSLISFHVYFQCKRYQGSVTASQVRDFRGAMQGRADKGLIVTTGNFTKDALKEASRDGAPPIDLVDGERLLEMLKTLSLGVSTEMVEQVTVDPTWFQKL